MLTYTRQQGLNLREGSFAALMELYENNYIFIRRLVPDIAQPPTHTVSHPEGSTPLYLEIIERCPYTSTASLTHYFPDTDKAHIASPDMVVRIYHDARVAEVLPQSTFEHFRVWTQTGEPAPKSLAWRWDVNRFLYRWLRFCLGEGHQFNPDKELI